MPHPAGVLPDREQQEAGLWALRAWPSSGQCRAGGQQASRRSSAGVQQAVGPRGGRGLSPDPRASSAIMARILGNLCGDDEYMHPLGPEPNFNESMYFNFFDRARRLGGWMRMGNRANEGYAEMTVCLYRPDATVLFAFARPKITDNSAFDAGGLRFEVLEPTERLRTCYEGRCVALAEPREMADPRKAFANNPWCEVSFDLVHEAVGPLYGQSHDNQESDKPAEEQFAKAHYEQHMRVRGTLVIDGESVDIDGFGLRDHSWGPRYWQAIHRYEWLTLNFGEDFGAMVSIIQRDAAGDDVRIGGVVVRGDTVDAIHEATIEADYEDNGLYHRALRARVRTASGDELDIRGDVRGFIPLRNRREERITHIGEGMTEWTCGDRKGWGLSEFLRQVEPTT
jgi:hypothetical protein